MTACEGALCPNPAQWSCAWRHRLGRGPTYWCHECRDRFFREFTPQGMERYLWEPIFVWEAR